MADDYTDISTSRTDADSPVDEDLALDYADNDRHNFSHALRCGTFATGVRLALARGTTAHTITTDGSGLDTQVVTITFATDCADGPPNFSAAPTCIGLVVQELSTGDDFGTNEHVVSVNINDTLPVSTTSAIVTINVRNGPTSQNIDTLLHWAFVGPVTAGE